MATVIGQADARLLAELDDLIIRRGLQPADADEHGWDELFDLKTMSLE